MMTLDTCIELTEEGRAAVLDTQTETTETAETFCINSTDRANWLLRKIANLDTEKARVKAQAEAILHGLDTDREGLLYLYGSQLEAFTRQELERQGSRRKSLTLLQGTCSFRSVPARFTLSDPGAALFYARENLPEAIKTVETLDRTAYLHRAETTGELLPGIESVPSREAFSLRFFGKDGTE